MILGVDLIAVTNQNDVCLARTEVGSTDKALKQMPKYVYKNKDRQYEAVCVIEKIY